MSVGAQNSRAHNWQYDPSQGRVVFSGFFGEVWEMLKEEMNFTYSVITPADEDFGRFNNGSWTGLIGDVLSGRAQVIVAYLSQTYGRAQVIDYSSVLIKFRFLTVEFVDSYRIFAKPPARSAVSWTSYTRPFSTDLWVSLAISLVVMSVVFYGASHWYLRTMPTERAEVLSSVEAERYRKWKKDSSMIMWSAFTQQGWPTSPEMGTLRVIFFTMYFMGVVVLASYSATLVSFLTVVDDHLPFDSLAELKRLGKYRLGIHEGTSLEEFFKNQNFRVYWDTLIEPYSDTLVKSYSELRARAMKDPEYAFVGTYEIQRMDPVVSCNFKTARQHLLFNDGALGWPGGSPYVQLFDYFINKFRESGLLHKLMRDWYPEPNPCPAQSYIPLGLQQVFTAFVMLGMGAVLSMLLLSVEKLFTQCRYQLLMRTFVGDVPDTERALKKTMKLKQLC